MSFANDFGKQKFGKKIRGRFRKTKFTTIWHDNRADVGYTVYNVRENRACGQRVMRGLQLYTVRRRPWSYYERTRHNNCATQTFSGRRRRGYRGSGCATLWAECSRPKGRPISAPRARRRWHCRVQLVYVRARVRVCYNIVFYCHPPNVYVYYMYIGVPTIYLRWVYTPGDHCVWGGGSALSPIADRARSVYNIILYAAHGYRETHRVRYS